MLVINPINIYIYIYILIIKILFLKFMSNVICISIHNIGNLEQLQVCIELWVSTWL